MKKIVPSDREKRFIVICILLVLIFALYRGLYVPLKQADESLQDQISSMQDQYIQTKKLMSVNKPFEKEYAQAVSCFKQTVPDKQQISTISTELESIAQDTQLKITASQPVKSKTTPQGNNFAVTVSLEGNFKDVLEFLYILQNCPHLYTVNQMTITTTPGSDNKVSCRLSLTKSLIK